METINREDLSLIVAVAQRGSLAAAGEQLGLTTSAVSKRLAGLEERLNMRLLVRTTRRVQLTAEGELLCHRATALLEGFNDLEAELQESAEEPSGEIRLASTFGFGRRWLGPLLAEFQQQYPRLQIRLSLMENLPDLARERLDGAIWLWRPPQRQTSEWVCRRLAPNQRVLVAAPSYLTRQGQPRSLQDLGHHQCLVVRENRDPHDRGQEAWNLSTGATHPIEAVRVDGALSSNSGEMVRDWCLAGHGIMLRSLWDVGPLIAQGALIRVLPDYAMHDADIHWLAPYRPQLPKRVRMLIDRLADRFAQEPWRQGSPSS